MGIIFRWYNEIDDSFFYLDFSKYKLNIIRLYMTGRGFTLIFGNGVDIESMDNFTLLEDALKFLVEKFL